MIDGNPIDLSTWLTDRPNDFRFAYLHVMCGDILQQQNSDIMTPIRTHYQGVFIGNMDYITDETDNVCYY